jgi:hypothetical protein
MAVVVLSCIWTSQRLKPKTILAFVGDHRPSARILRQWLSLNMVPGRYRQRLTRASDHRSSRCDAGMGEQILCGIGRLAGLTKNNFKLSKG